MLATEQTSAVHEEGDLSQHKHEHKEEQRVDNIKDQHLHQEHNKEEPRENIPVTHTVHPEPAQIHASHEQPHREVSQDVEEESVQKELPREEQVQLHKEAQEEVTSHVYESGRDAAKEDLLSRKEKEDEKKEKQYDQENGLSGSTQQASNATLGSAVEVQPKEEAR